MQLKKVGIRLQWREDGTHVVLQGELENGKKEEIASARVPDIEGDFEQWWDLDAYQTRGVSAQQAITSLQQVMSQAMRIPTSLIDPEPPTSERRATHLTRVLAAHLRRTFELTVEYSINRGWSEFFTHNDTYNYRFVLDHSEADMQGSNFHVESRWLAYWTESVDNAYREQQGHPLIRRTEEEVFSLQQAGGAAGNPEGLSVRLTRMLAAHLRGTFPAINIRYDCTDSQSSFYTSCAVASSRTYPRTYPRTYHYDFVLEHGSNHFPTRQDHGVVRAWLTLVTDAVAEAYQAQGQTLARTY